MDNRTHELKTWPEYFKKVKSGEKNFELRKNDRNFKVGDTLLLKEFIPLRYKSVNPNELTGKYTGEEISVTITYIFNGRSDGLPFGLFNDYCIMSIAALQSVTLVEEKEPEGKLPGLDNSKVIESNPDLIRENSTKPKV